MVPIAMKHYHITASNGVVRCISTAKFIAVKYDFIGIAQEGLSYPKELSPCSALREIWLECRGQKFSLDSFLNP